MAVFLELTDPHNRKLRLKADAVEAYKLTNTGTTKIVSSAGVAYEVAETIEEIDCMLDKYADFMGIALKGVLKKLPPQPTGEQNA
jgi:hypothetical protein